MCESALSAVWCILLISHSLGFLCPLLLVAAELELLELFPPAAAGKFACPVAATTSNTSSSRENPSRDSCCPIWRCFWAVEPPSPPPAAASETASTREVSCSGVASGAVRGTDCSLSMLPPNPNPEEEAPGSVLGRRVQFAPCRVVLVVESWEGTSWDDAETVAVVGEHWQSIAVATVAVVFLPAELELGEPVNFGTCMLRTP